MDQTLRDTAVGHEPESATPAGRTAPVDRMAPVLPRAAAAMPALTLQDVSHRFGPKLAVDGVDIAIHPGEIVCLVGPSGCGKSTLLRLAAGLEDLQTGMVAIGGTPIAGPGYALPPERRGIGLVFQDYALFPHLSVLDNVRFGLNRLPPHEQRERAMARLRQVGMEGFAAGYPHALSGGQQQRVALARALAPNPAVLLLDEPFSGLDARLREQVRDQTLHVLKASGAATMLVTHDPEEAMFLADRIVLMRDGRVVQVGTPADLYMRPVNDFAAGFFGEVNALRGTVRGGKVETPVGPVLAQGRAEGEQVRVLIRPEALRLDSEQAAGPPNLARVEAARLLGRTSLVHLCIHDGRGGTVHLHARVPGLFLPEEGRHVAVSLDPRQAFVFPAGDPI